MRDFHTAKLTASREILVRCMECSPLLVDLSQCGPGEHLAPVFWLVLSMNTGVPTAVDGDPRPLGVTFRYRF